MPWSGCSYALDGARNDRLGVKRQTAAGLQSNVVFSMMGVLQGSVEIGRSNVWQYAQGLFVRSPVFCCQADVGLFSLLLPPLITISTSKMQLPSVLS